MTVGLSNLRRNSVIKWSIGCGISLLFSVQCFAVSIEVLRKNGEPAAGVVVTLKNDSITMEPAATVEMGQRKRQFDPHILVVPKGATVSFPNYDDIKHHVYSFSSVKSFEKELYKGRESSPETFDTAGVVELGCNVHDWMLGYIYIADTPWFGTTDEQGKLTLADVPDGEYEVTVWHPRLDNDSNAMTTLTSIKGVYRLTLRDAMEEEESSEFDFDFDDY